MRQCPLCKGSAVKVLVMGKSGGAQIVYDRRCEDCGTIWRPPVSKWMGVASIVVGCLFLLIASAQRSLSAGLAFFSVMGASFAALGVRVIRGDKQANLTIIKWGAKPKEAD